MTEHSAVLVTGATGNVGRQVVSQLLGTGVAVRALTRKPDSAVLPGAVEVVRGSPGWSGPSSGATHSRPMRCGGHHKSEPMA